MISDLSREMAAGDELPRRDELAERLRWLINLRWVALACVCVVVFVARNLLVSIWPLVSIALGMGVLNAGFHALHTTMPPRTLRALSAEALLQSAVDVIGLALLMFFAGGLHNPFVFFFCFHAVIAAILLEKRQAYGVAVLTAGVVLFLGVAEEWNLNAAWQLEGALASARRAPLATFGLVFAIGTTQVISVYMVTAIMERLRAHSRDVRRLNADLADRVERLAGAERKLAAEHHRARAILECMEEGVVVVDLQGQVLLANTAAQHSALLALDDTLRQAGCHEQPHISECESHDHAEGEDACPMGTAAACLSEILSKGGKLCPATLALLGADPPKAQNAPVLTAPKSPTLAQIEIQGRRFENTVSAVHTSANDILGVVIVSRDVTARRSLERQVFHAEKLHALGNLAAGVAHELNTPLGTILGYAQMMLDDAANSRKELIVIEDQARRCRKIVQGLLDLARKSSSGRSEFLANDLAIKMRDVIAHTLELRGIHLHLDLCEPAPPRIRMAVDELEQVLVNLVTNAADAIEMAVPLEYRRHPAGQMEHTGGTPAGRDGGTTTLENPTICIQTRWQNGEVLIAVDDDGPGIAPDVAEQIFEPFFTTKAAGRGTGLGLPIARRIIEDHNGRLLLTQRANGRSGARFEIRLPTRSANQESKKN